MPPIRIGFIGPSATGGWAQSAHLPYLRMSSKYIITALCNSRVDSAKAAIKAHDLYMRSGRAVPSRAEIEWSIYGFEGEIKVIAGGPALQVGYSETKILLHRNPEGKGGEVEEVKWA